MFFLLNLHPAGSIGAIKAATALSAVSYPSIYRFTEGQMTHGLMFFVEVDYKSIAWKSPVVYSCFHTSGCVDSVIPDDLVDIVNSEVLLNSFF